MTRTILGVGLGALLAMSTAARVPGTLPDPSLDEPASPGSQTAVLAGGCFWGVEGVFEHVKGVSEVVSGYAGGESRTATYDQVSSGTTGHAEAVRITYDPSVVTYGQLLKVFFAVAHNSTELNRQGPDTGTQYRSAVFYANDEQQRIAEAYIEQLQAAQAFSRPIVTEVTPLDGFLCRRGLPSGLSGAASRSALHRHPRPAQDRRAAEETAWPLHRALSGGAPGL